MELLKPEGRSLTVFLFSILNQEINENGFTSMLRSLYEAEGYTIIASKQRQSIQTPRRDIKLLHLEVKKQEKFGKHWKRDELVYNDVKDSRCVRLDMYGYDGMK